MRCVFKVLILFLTAQLLCSALHSQTTTISNSTATPIAGVGHDYIQDLDEVVNPANGSVSVRVSAPLPGERSLNYPAYTLIYDTGSQLQITPTFETDSTTTPVSYTVSNVSVRNSIYSIIDSVNVLGANYGRGTVTLQEVTLSQPEGAGGGTLYCHLYDNFIYTDPNGGLHALNMRYVLPVDEGNCSSHFGVYGSILSGGDEMYHAQFLNPSVNLYPIIWDNHGNQMDPYLAGSGMEDTNGNYLNSTGRIYSYTLNNPPANQPQYYTSQTLPGVGKYSYNYPTQTSTISSATFSATPINPPSSVDGKLPCVASFSNAISELNGNLTLTLPNAQTYVLEFDPVYGLLDKITYPTGAWVKYQWALNPQSAAIGFAIPNSSPYCDYRYDWPAIKQRTVSFDGTNAALEQDFSYAPTVWSAQNPMLWTSKTTTVTTKDLTHPQNPISFDTIYTYLPSTAYVQPYSVDNVVMADALPVENTITYKDTNGSVIKTVTKTWNSPLQQTAECVTLPSAGTSGTFYQYVPNTLVKTDIAEYDYAQVSSNCQRPVATPVRETATVYNVFAANPMGTSMQDSPSSVKVYGNGTLLSEINYSYDEYVVSQVTPAALSHDTLYSFSNSVPRGNVTTVTKKCLQQCSDSVSHSSYNETGQVVSSTDANGNPPTTYSYADSYSTDNGAPPGNTNAYLTKVSGPLTNGVAHVESYTYGYNDGKVRTLTDENSHLTKYCYYVGGCTGSNFDPWFRVTGSVFPDGGGTTISYSDAGPNPSMATATVMNSSTTRTTKVMYDAYGHVIRTQLLSDPSGADTVDTVYNGIGLPYTVSNAYRNGGPSYLTTYMYDALGRKTAVLHPDNTSLGMAYSDNNETDTDEAGHTTTLQTDALGRLTNVSESTSLFTSYSYDALNNLTSVAQLGKVCVPGSVNPGGSGTCTSDTPRNRSFTYDSLSRLLTAATPETGTSCAGLIETIGGSCSSASSGYDANGNLLYWTDANGRTLAYSYDALNRMVQKSGPPSDYQMTASSFSYDQGTNGIGRLTSESTVGHIYTGYTYDSMGRVLSEEFQDYPYNYYYPTSGAQSPPGWNNLSGAQIPGLFSASDSKSYAQYDLMGNLVQITYPDGRVVKQIFDGAGRLEAVTDATPGGTSVNYFAGGVGGSSAYTPDGSLANFTLGNGVSQTNQYNNRLQLCRTWASSPALPANSTGANGNLIDRENFYSNGAPTNCGNEASNDGDIWSIVDKIQVENSQSFSYDSLNRLTGGFQSGGAYNHTYNYDSFGNMILQDNLHGNPAWSIDPATNRLLLGSDYQYNSAGQLIAAPSHTFAYTAGGNLFSIDGAQTGSYIYDASDERAIAVHNNSTWNKYFYLNGQMVADIDNTGNWTDYIYANGRKIATVQQAAGVDYYLYDPLGTTRMELAANSTPIWQGQFTPFGQEIVAGNTAAPTIGPEPPDGTAMRYKFTGKERDAESGLDDFGARYYGSSLGRFISPDAAADTIAMPYAELSNPQSLNLYSYVGNNPLSRVDSDGHIYSICLDGLKCFTLGDEQYHALYKQQNGKQGINLPGFGGDVTCGGVTCGTISYSEQGLIDQSGGQLATFAGIRVVNSLVRGLFSAVVGSSNPETAPTSTPTLGGSSGARASRLRQLFGTEGPGKIKGSPEQAARAALQRLQETKQLPSGLVQQDLDFYKDVIVKAENSTNPNVGLQSARAELVNLAERILSGK